MKNALALLSILLLSACQSSQEIVSNLSEFEANEILVVLDGQDIQATKILVPVKIGNKPPTYSVQVSGFQTMDAMRILVDNRLPNSKSAGLGEVYPSDSSALIPSRTEEKAKFLRAIQGEIENMLKTLPDIVEARVIIVMPDQDVIRDLHAAPPKATASVAVVYNPIDSKGTAPVKAEEIKYLVASAVEDLSTSGVTVVMSQNLSSRLVGLPKLVKKQPLVSPASTELHPATPPQTEHTHPVVTVKQPSLFKDDMVVTLFGILAIVGILLGLFGMIRNRSLRQQLSKALESHAAENEPPAPSAG
jgi:type III secretion system YscJ/HrcJ family lipoprotein